MCARSVTVGMGLVMGDLERPGAMEPFEEVEDAPSIAEDDVVSELLDEELVTDVPGFPRYPRIPGIDDGGTYVPPKPVTAADLPLDVQAYLGQPCCCGDAGVAYTAASGDPSEPPPTCVAACPPNPHVTCQVDGSAVASFGYTPGQVVNAEKGDLLLSPGSFDGMIGALLGALDPQQHYTHMGIFVDDGFHVRHCTQLRKFKEDVFFRGSVLGQAAPTGGLDPDAVRFGWPGTVTQHVEDAWVAEDPGDRLALAPNTDPKAHQILDPITKDAVWINALSFNDILIEEPDPQHPGGTNTTTLHALVVKPCPALLTDKPWVRPLLWAAADAAKTIAGHYRFFAYTDSRISQDPALVGPPMLEEHVYGGPCNPPSPVTATLPMQCASFVWTAILQAIANGAGAALLDGDAFGDLPAVAPCIPTVPPQPAGDHPDPTNPPPDGLYSYTAAERAVAAKALYEKIRSQVSDQIASKKKTLIAVMGLSPLAAPIVEGFLGAITGTPLGSLGFLGLTAETIEALGALQKIPDTVASQILNSFSNDSAPGADWRDPSPGTAVGPDNTAWFWESPHADALDSKRPRMGLYGFNAPVNYHPGKWTKVPSKVWAVSGGPGHVRGTVTRNGHSLDGLVATVAIGCNLANIATEGGYSLEIPGGTYLATAVAEDPANGWHLEGETVVTIPPFGVAECTIDLKDPDPRFRLIQVTTDGTLTRDESLLGDDVKNYPSDRLNNAFVGPFDGRKDWTGADKSTAVISRQWGVGSDDSSTIGKLTINLTWTGFDFGSDPPLPSNMVQCEVLMQIINSDDNSVEASWNSIGYLAEDGTETFSQSVDTDEDQADHFAMTFHVSNLRMP
jgi:hypothetical protein